MTHLIFPNKLWPEIKNKSKKSWQCMKIYRKPEFSLASVIISYCCATYCDLTWQIMSRLCYGFYKRQYIFSSVRYICIAIIITKVIIISTARWLCTDVGNQCPTWRPAHSMRYTQKQVEIVNFEMFCNKSNVNFIPVWYGVQVIHPSPVYIDDIMIKRVFGWWYWL